MRVTYGDQPNLDLVDFVDQFDSDGLSRHLSRSWILINTAAREGLPITFIEASAHRCAILSAVDPDGFTSRFGHQVTDGDFAAGLRSLLENDQWRARGERGRAYVADTYETSRAVDRHMAAYRAVADAMG